MESYVLRLIDRRLEDVLAALPAVLLVGPRAAGKTTTARRHAVTVVRLDREAEAVAFRADPDAALRGLEEPVLLDEWQEVPGVLGAVKRAVDDEPQPGRFLLTGSVRAELESTTWPGTGRLIRLHLWGLSARELRGDASGPSLIDRLRTGDATTLSGPRSRLDLRDYVELALASGFPEAVLHLSEEHRRLWLDSYVDQLVTRDATELRDLRDPERLRRYLEALAVNTAGIVDDRTLYETAGINRRTAVAYEQLLANLLVLDRLPAWFSNRLKRLVRRPKRHLTDTGLLAAVVGATPEAVLSDGDLLGRTLDSYVTAQFRAEASAARVQCRLYHLRTKEGRQEVDLLIETPGGLIAVEIKASASPDRSAAAGLIWLREQLNERFVLGLVCHTGGQTYELDRDILAVPIASLWTR